MLPSADAILQPVELVLLSFVGCEVLERAPEGPCIEGDDGKAGFRQLGGKRAAARARADNGESTTSSSRYSRIGTHPPRLNTSGARPWVARGTRPLGIGFATAVHRCTSSSVRAFDTPSPSQVSRRLAASRTKREWNGLSQPWRFSQTSPCHQQPGVLSVRKSSSADARCPSERHRYAIPVR